MTPTMTVRRGATPGAPDRHSGLCARGGADEETG